MRVAAESSATLARACVSALLLLSAHQSLPLPLAFAAAQCAAAVSLVAVYCADAGLRRTRRPAPASRPAAGAPPAALLRTFAAQSLLKLVLAEGDKACAAALLAPPSLGCYGLASNLGALAVRCLLAPLEEAAYGCFARCGGGPGAGALAVALLRPLLLVGCFTACVGPFYAQPCVLLLYGPGWAAQQGAVWALAAFAPLFPLLALNGVLEAAADAEQSAAQLRRRLGVLTAAAALQALVSALFVPLLGPAALVVANAAGYALRIAQQGGLRLCADAAPSRHTRLALAAAALAAAYSHAAYRHAPDRLGALARHAAVGLAAAAGVGLAAVRYDGARSYAADFRGGGAVQARPSSKRD